jgi:hypothetical protein
MSRYISIDDIVFIDQNGKSNKIKDIRPIPAPTTKIIIPITKNDDLDEISSRREINGENGEILSYTLFDNNIIKIVENDFSLDFSELRIPL